MSKKTPIPAHLEKSGRAWLRSILADYPTISEPSDFARAVMAAGCLDRVDQARAAIKEHGLLIATGHGGQKPNPGVGIERDAKVLFARLCRELRLGDLGEDDDRIPRIAKGGR